MILRCFYIRDANILTKVFTVYVLPLLEYCCSVWSPNYAGLIDNIESVQTYFTKKLRGVEHLLYIDRLKTENYTTWISTNKAWQHSILKIVHDLIEIDPKTSLDLSKTVIRDHDLKILAKI